jgi:hypothetical protein
MNNILLLKFVEISLQSCHYFMSLKYSNANNKKTKTIPGIIQENSDNCTIDSEFNDSEEEQDNEWESNEDDHYEEEDENVEEEENREEEVEIEYRSIFESVQSCKENNVNTEISNFLARPPVLDIDINPFEW